VEFAVVCIEGAVLFETPVVFVRGLGVPTGGGRGLITLSPPVPVAALIPAVIPALKSPMLFVIILPDGMALSVRLASNTDAFEATFWIGKVHSVKFVDNVDDDPVLLLVMLLVTMLPLFPIITPKPICACNCNCCCCCCDTCTPC